MEPTCLLVIRTQAWFYQNRGRIAMFPDAAEDDLRQRGVYLRLQLHATGHCQTDGASQNKWRKIFCLFDWARGVTRGIRMMMIKSNLIFDFD